MIYHFYKTNCNKASRVLMQCRWDDEFSFIHIDPNGDGGSSLKFGCTTLLQKIFKLANGDAIVFHSQSSLPYLLLAFLFKKIFFLKGRYVYDIHDLHEQNSNSQILSRDFLRYWIFLFFEYLSFKINEIPKLTVSDGLSNVMSIRYSANKPGVVMNISVEPIQSRGPTGGQRLQSIVFFGTKERFPIDALPELVRGGFELHVYSRDVDATWLANRLSEREIGCVKLFGEYHPNKLDFLPNYDLTIIYSPEDKSLNFRHSLPNKLFQALSAGVTVLVSENFEEMLDLFSDTPCAVLPVNLSNLGETARLARISKKKNIENDKLSSQIKLLQSNSRRIYLEATKG